MCGIAGFAGGFLPQLGRRMNVAQAHRGPDGTGVYENPAAGIMLAHVRLAILDLTTAADQPMKTPDGRLVLVFNGEIYNYPELRQELVDKGCVIRSTGDTEVLLRGLELYGEEFISRLNGMFAFALWDESKRELLLARDPLGIKPLYYAQPAPGTLLFASEIKALLKHPGLSRDPDFFALQQHLTFCHASGERTAFKAVKRLSPGGLLKWKADGGQIEGRKYWTPRFQEPLRLDHASAVLQLREELKHAVKRQMISDVPVGAYFSGGLDSSLIARLAVDQDGKDFRCYTIAYPPSENVLDQAADDFDYARRLVEELKVTWDPLIIKPEVVSLWPQLIYHLDEPIADPAAIACYLISQQAKVSGTTVLLSGQGGDELFGGYPRYWAMYATQWVDNIPSGARHLIAEAARRVLPGAWSGRFGANLRRIRRVLVELGRNKCERFMAYCSSTPQPEISGVLHPDVAEEIGQEHGVDECLRMMLQAPFEGLDRCLLRDLTVYLPNHNLLYTDKMGMAVGLEARVPLLDQKLVDMVTAWPLGWKVNKGHTKIILREAAEGWVPPEIIHRRKGGFGAPYRKWLRHDLREMWEDLTSEAVVKRRGWFDYQALKNIRARSQSGQVDLYMLQWAVLTIELWARIFIDNVDNVLPNTESDLWSSDCFKSPKTSEMGN